MVYQKIPDGAYDRGVYAHYFHYLSLIHKLEQIADSGIECLPSHVAFLSHTVRKCNLSRPYGVCNQTQETFQSLRVYTALCCSIDNDDTTNATDDT